MCKPFKVIVLLLLLSVRLCAQSERPNFTFGIKGGFNHTVIKGFETDGDRTGFIGSTAYGTLFVEKSIASNMFVSGGLTFSWVNDWHFLEIPVHFRLLLNRRVSVFGGPKLDISADRFDPQKESTSKLFGISTEFGSQYSFKDHLFVEAAYSFGLSKSINDAFFDINNARRNNFRIGVGYQF